MRVEAPADAIFPPHGRVSMLMPDGTEHTRWYHSVYVVPPRVFDVASSAEDGSELHVTLHMGASIPASGGDVLVRVGKGPQQLFSYSHAMPSKTDPDQAVLYAQPGKRFPAGVSELTMATTGLLFKAVKALPFPGTDLRLPVSELVVTPMLPAQDPEFASDVFPIVEVSSDGSIARLVAPVSAASHTGGVLQVQGSDGSVSDVAYRSAGEVPSDEFKVHTVEKDGSQALIKVGRRVLFPPGPGKVKITTPDGVVGELEYSDAAPVDHEIVRVTAAAPHTFPVDALSISPSLPGLLVRAQGWSRFPARAADGPVATYFAHSMPRESQGGWPVTAVSDEGRTLRIYAQATSPIPPASSVEIRVPDGPAQQFAYDSVSVAPPAELEVKQVLDDGRRLLLKVTDVALAPEGVVRVAGADEDDGKLLAYDSLMPGDEEGEVIIALARGDIVPAGTSSVSQHPAGLLLHSPESAPAPVLPASTAGGVVSESWAGVVGHSGMHRYAVTGQSKDRTVIRVEAPPELGAWEARGEWGIELEQADGLKVVLPVESVRPAKEQAISVLHVSANGVVAILNIHAVAIPPPPATVLATTADGQIKRVRYVSATSISADDIASLPAGMPVQPKGASLVRVLFPPGHLLPVDTQAISPIGGLEFTSPSSAPFPSLLDSAIATAFASPAPAPLNSFPVTFVRSEGSELGLQVPDDVRPFMGRESGSVELRTAEGVEERLPYARWKRESGATYQVAFVQTGGGGLALHPREDRSFPPGPGVLHVTGKDGKEEVVKYSRAGIIKGVTGAGAHKLIVVVAASGTKFHKDAAKATTGPVDVLVAGPGIKFDESLASATLAESLGSPVSTKTRVLRADESTGRIDPVDVLDGADHSAAHGSAAYPFQYGVLWLAQGGKEMDLFAAEGEPLPFESDGKLNLLVRCPDDDGAGTEMEVAWEGQAVAEELRVAIVKEGDIDHLDLVVELENGRAFPPGPGMLALTLEHGKVVVSGYDSVTPLGSPSYPGGARQVAVTAPFGLPFPHTPQAVRPLGVIIRVSSMDGELFPSKFRDGCFALPRPAVGWQAGPKPAEAKVKPEHHLVKVVKKTTEPHGRDDKFAWRWLKPHPAVSSLLADSSRQYMVGVLGNGKRGYLDAALEFRGVPSHLVGRPYVMTASADADSQVFKGFMSLYVDEPTDLYILVPPDQPQKKGSKKSAENTLLSWLPFSLPSLSSSSSKAPPMPAWIQEGFIEHDAPSSFALGSRSLRLFKSKSPLIGHVELGGRSASPVEGSPRMYIPVLVPSAVSAAAAEEWAGELEVKPEDVTEEEAEEKELGVGPSELTQGGVELSPADIRGMEVACGGRQATAACVIAAQKCAADEQMGDVAACKCFQGSETCAATCMERIRSVYDRQVVLQTGRPSPCL